jgi:lipoprotein-anchoring transpeptidase ErfK/SrfK
LAVLSAVGAPIAHSDQHDVATDPASPTTTIVDGGAGDVSTTDPAPPGGSVPEEQLWIEGGSPAVRLPAFQVTPTLPPPPPPPPPPVATTPARSDSAGVPANSGSGRRAVYSKSRQRVWLIDSDGEVFHTHRVSGRQDQPRPGTYSVWSRSTNTCSRSSPDVCMRWMVRFAFSFRGDNIGFHEIPRRNGVPLQNEAQLGQALSAGCIRQATSDALIVWNWAQIGTVVVVLP